MDFTQNEGECMPGKFDALTAMEKGVLHEFNFLLGIAQTGHT